MRLLRICCWSAATACSFFFHSTGHAWMMTENAVSTAFESWTWYLSIGLVIRIFCSVAPTATPGWVRVVRVQPEHLTINMHLQTLQVNSSTLHFRPPLSASTLAAQMRPRFFLGPQWSRPLPDTPPSRSVVGDSLIRRRSIDILSASISEC